MSTPSPLHEVHTELGATFTDFAGWSMPLRYGSELAEHKAVREAAGLFDLSHMGEIELTGPEAARALDYALVGNLSGVKVGRARYTMICDARRRRARRPRRVPDRRGPLHGGGERVERRGGGRGAAAPGPRGSRSRWRTARGTAR